MNNSVQNQGWRDGYTDTLWGCLVIGFFGGLYLTTFLGIIGALRFVENYIIIVGLLLMVVIALAYYNIVGEKRYRISKFVMTDFATTRQIVANVLRQKGVPFKEMESRFIVGEMSIVIRSGALNRGAVKGSMIALGPYRGENRLLIDSLKTKIDAAFVPRGL